MTDQTNDIEDDEEEEEDEEYNVEYTITIKGTLMASSEEEAESMADQMQMEISVQIPGSFTGLPDGWDALDDPDYEHTVESVQERAARDYKWRQAMAEAVEESASEPGDG